MTHMVLHYLHVLFIAILETYNVFVGCSNVVLDRYQPHLLSHYKYGNV